MKDFRTSPAQFSDFLKGFIWKDIKRELLELRETARDAMEGTDDEEERRRFAYRARTIWETIIMIEGFAIEAEEVMMVDVDRSGNPIDSKGEENE